MVKTTFLLTASFSLSAFVSACGSSPTPPTSETAASSTSTAPANPASSAEPGAEAEGKTCNSSADCAPGELCTGEVGCDKTWTCKPSQPCTKDLVPYCGCDGETFRSSGSCPGKKYKAKGGC